MEKVSSALNKVGAPDNWIVALSNPDAPGQKPFPGIWIESHCSPKPI